MGVTVKVEHANGLQLHNTEKKDVTPLTILPSLAPLCHLKVTELPYTPSHHFITWVYTLVKSQYHLYLHTAGPAEEGSRKK